jgi:hypothetical protein
MQVSSKEVVAFVETARAHDISLDGVELLVSIHRQEFSPAHAEVLAAHPEIVGFDVVGAEDAQQDPTALLQTVDALARVKRSRPVLRVHAGEGFLGDGGHDNVNVVLATLATRAERGDLAGLKLILGHAARIRDLPAAAAHIAALRARGVIVEVNVNPLSNLVYHAAEDLSDIAALKLPGEVMVAGSDNVGTLAQNQEVTRALVEGRVEDAERQLRHLRRLSGRWRRAR